MTTRRQLTPEEQQEAERLSAAWLAYKAENKGANQTWLAAVSELGTQGAVGQYLRGVIPLNLDALLAICRIIKADPQKISPRLASKIDGIPSSDIFKREMLPAGSRAVVSADDTDSEVGYIPYWSAKGSCGGGFMNYEPLPKGHLTKEASFFKKYDLKPQDSFAIYADGNSMSDFIVDGDLVIFNKAKTIPISGEIFAIEHPDGLRIKRLRRKIDGTWVLESRNHDKQKYPDEEISQEQGELLQIIGQFVYRQGG